ncbi:MAG: hypothetical protein GY839_16700 [candidate division Zixibacteria bacterium]|nr:hypothetical protein [candidate division Zixibacteria bacterium]
MSNETVAVLSRLQARVNRLEAELAALRGDLEQVIKNLTKPVVVYEIEGEQIVITEADIEVVWAQLANSHPQEAIRELALINKLAELEKELPEAEIRRLIAEDY